MCVGLKQPRGDGERYVTPAQAAAKETNTNSYNNAVMQSPVDGSQRSLGHLRLYPVSRGAFTIQQANRKNNESSFLKEVRCDEA